MVGLASDCILEQQEQKAVAVAVVVDVVVIGAVVAVVVAVMVQREGLGWGEQHDRYGRPPPTSPRDVARRGGRG